MGKKLTIEEMQKLAKSRGGKCLSKEYINSSTKLKWKCKEGHEWEATPNNIKRGEWCRSCYWNKLKSSIKEIQELAKVRGGKCLSKEYINARAKLKWRCKEGHEWKSRPDGIQEGKWCPLCAGNQKLTIEEMQKLAKSLGGKCLSTKYINSYTKLKWKCKEGHEWEAAPYHIKRGRWCSICSMGISERICHILFEKRFKKRFKHIRPKWLQGLELDGYCKTLRLAFEYNGKQHYEFVKSWHINIDGFKRQQKRDKLKRELCKKNNVTLIEIPYTIPSYELDVYIKNKIKKLGFHNIKHNEYIDYTKFNIYPKDKIKELQKIAKIRGGKCLSNVYINGNTPLKWKCKEGHEWVAVSRYIKNSGIWCPVCAAIKRKTKRFK